MASGLRSALLPGGRLGSGKRNPSPGWLSSRTSQRACRNPSPQRPVYLLRGRPLHLRPHWHSASPLQPCMGRARKGWSCGAPQLRPEQRPAILRLLCAPSLRQRRLAGVADTGPAEVFLGNPGIGGFWRVMGDLPLIIRPRGEHPPARERCTPLRRQLTN